MSKWEERVFLFKEGWYVYLILAVVITSFISIALTLSIVILSIVGVIFYQIKKRQASQLALNEERIKTQKKVEKIKSKLESKKTEANNNNVAFVHIDKLIGDLKFLTYNGSPFTGIAYDLHPNGELIIEGNYVNGIRSGESKTFYDNGQLDIHGQYDNGKMTGKFTFYYNDGVLSRETHYKDNMENGLSVKWNHNGIKEYEQVWYNGQLKDEKICNHHGNLKQKGICQSCSKTKLVSKHRMPIIYSSMSHLKMVCDECYESRYSDSPGIL